MCMLLLGILERAANCIRRRKNNLPYIIHNSLPLLSVQNTDYSDNGRLYTQIYVHVCRYREIIFDELY